MIERQNMGKKKKSKIKKLKKDMERQQNELADLLRGIKGSSTEKEVNTIHNLVNQGITIKLGSQLLQANRLMKEDKIEDAGFELDMQDFAQGIRWCMYNKSTTTPEISKELDEIDKELKALQKKHRTHNKRVTVSK